MGTPHARYEGVSPPWAENFVFLCPLRPQQARALAAVKHVAAPYLPNYSTTVPGTYVGTHATPAEFGLHRP